MSNKLQSFSIIFLGVCILFGCWLIAQALSPTKDIQPDVQHEVQHEQQFRYEFMSPNETNIIIFDKQTGEYWRKYIPPHKGPTNWEKEQSPVSTTVQ